MKKSNNRKKMKKVKLITEQWTNKDEIRSDTLGSYTGTPDDRNSVPEQDADDL